MSGRMQIRDLVFVAVKVFRENSSVIENGKHNYDVYCPLSRSIQDLGANADLRSSFRGRGGFQRRFKGNAEWETQL